MSNLGDSTIERPRSAPAVDDGPRQTSEETVIVACKLPNGLILQCDDAFQVLEPVLGGGSKEITRYRRNPETYRVNGSALDLAKMEIGDISVNVSAGYALTYGIPKAFWDRWLEQHKGMDIVKNQLIFAMKSENSIRSKTRDYKDIKSGLEPIDPQNPAARTGMKKIMTGVRE